MGPVLWFQVISDIRIPDRNQNSCRSPLHEEICTHEHNRPSLGPVNPILSWFQTLRLFSCAKEFSVAANFLALLKITQLNIFHKLILYRQKKPLCCSSAAHVPSLSLLLQILAIYPFYNDMKINQLLGLGLIFIKWFPTVLCFLFLLFLRG